MTSIERQIRKDAVNRYDDTPPVKVERLVKDAEALRYHELIELRRFLDRLEELSW